MNKTQHRQAARAQSQLISSELFNDALASVTEDVAGILRDFPLLVLPPVTFLLEKGASGKYRLHAVAIYPEKSLVTDEEIDAFHYDAGKNLGRTMHDTTGNEVHDFDGAILVEPHVEFRGAPRPWGYMVLGRTLDGRRCAGCITIHDDVPPARSGGERRVTWGVVPELEVEDIHDTLAPLIAGYLSERFGTNRA
jgi:hypothetical protein